MRGLVWTLVVVSWALVVVGRPHKIEILESQLDSNRSYINSEGERIYVPKRLPKLTRDQKFAFLQKQGIDTSSVKHKKSRKHRRSLDKPWRIQYVERNEDAKIRKGPLLSVDPHLCPARFDAITEGQNHRTYIFSGSHVYTIWRENGLQQKAAYKIADLFPGGPPTVTAAMTNLHSGVTILIQRRKVYRFRWNKKEKRFYQTRKSPVDLTPLVEFTPTLAFQWRDGHLILSDGKRFATYDPFWNTATFTGKITDYFPNVPADSIGLAHKNGPSTYLLLTSKNELEIYDMKKFKIVQEYPLSVHNYVACMSKELVRRTSKQ